jgi:hypothetical protein
VKEEKRILVPTAPFALLPLNKKRSSAATILGEGLIAQILPPLRTKSRIQGASSGTSF